MKFNIYAVKDLKKETYLQPFFIPFYQKNEDVITDFARNLKAAESIISKFPEDFELWEIGEFYDETGVFNPIEQKKVASAVELLKEKNEDVGNTEVN